MRRLLSALAQLAVCVAAAVAFWHVTIEPLRTNLRVTAIEARTREMQNMDMLSAAPLARENIATLRRLMRIAPRNVDIYMLLSMNSYMLQRYDDSIDYLNQALRVDHRPEIYMNRGFSYMETGRSAEAIEDFARAARFNNVYLDPLDASTQDAVRKAMNRP